MNVSHHVDAEDETLGPLEEELVPLTAKSFN